MNKKKLLLIIFSCFAGLLLVGGIGLAVGLSYVPLIPSKVEILDSGSEVFLKAQQNESFNGYRFKIRSKGQEIYYDSESNLVNCKNLSLTNGTEYIISVCYLGEGENANSKYSKELVWSAYSYLEKPKCTNDGLKIVWQSVENAEYYNVFYNGKTQGFITTKFNEISLQSFPRGNTKIYVVAMSNEVSFKPSVASEPISLTIVQELNSFKSISYDQTSYTLSLTGSELVEGIVLTVNSTEFKVRDFTVTLDRNGDYVFTFSVKAIYNGNGILAARPETDNYQRFIGEPIYLNT